MKRVDQPALLELGYPYFDPKYMVDDDETDWDTIEKLVTNSYRKTVGSM